MLEKERKVVSKLERINHVQKDYFLKFVRERLKLGQTRATYFCNTLGLANVQRISGYNYSSYFLSFCQDKI